MDFEQFDSVIKDTCINYGVPRSDLNGATSAFSLSSDTSYSHRISP